MDGVGEQEPSDEAREWNELAENRTTLDETDACNVQCAFTTPICMCNFLALEMEIEWIFIVLCLYKRSENVHQIPHRSWR